MSPFPSPYGVLAEAHYCAPWWRRFLRDVFGVGEDYFWRRYLALREGTASRDGAPMIAWLRSLVGWRYVGRLGVWDFDRGIQRLLRFLA